MERKLSLFLLASLAQAEIWNSATITGDLTKPVENTSDKCYATGQDLIETRVPQFCMFEGGTTIQNRCCSPVHDATIKESYAELWPGEC